MTCPTGTITMANVKTELGISGTLTLTDSRVRTLAGKPTGTITLRDCCGKSAVAYYRPTGMTYTGTAPLNSSYAYDTTAASVDTTSSAAYTHNGYATSTHTYAFGSGFRTGTLRVRVADVETITGTSMDDSRTLASSVEITVSTNGGSSYQGSQAGESFDQISFWSGWDNESGTGIVLTKSLTNQDIANLRVKVVAISNRAGTLDNLAVAPVTINISDIVVY